MVVSTGLDATFELNRSGELIHEWSAAEDGDVWGRFDKDTDYRKVLTTKPHEVHPNYGFEYKSDIWVSRFLQKDVMNLNTFETIDIGVGNPHDGVLVGDRAYCTTTNGFIVCIDVNKKKRVLTEDLKSYYTTKKNIGWCRAIYPISDEKFIVGFSRIRPTKFEENILWLKRKVTDGYQGCLPTRLTCFDLQTKRIDWEINLEEHGMNAVFSVF